MASRRRGGTRPLLCLLLAAAVGCDQPLGQCRDDGCTAAAGTTASTFHRRYLTYTVNPGEGFNLARDVFVRAASLMKRLRERDPAGQWTLVLPPFTNPHWRRDRDNQKWSLFFDTDELARLFPVMEFEEYLNLKQGANPVIDQVYHLQRFDTGGKWEPTVVDAACDFGTYPGTAFEERADGWHHHFWGFRDRVAARSLSCLGVFGGADVIADRLLETPARLTMVARFEMLLHVRFGSQEFWDTRRRLVFARPLQAAAGDFVDSAIQTGAYLAVHMRRADFLRSRKKDVPKLLDTVQQIRHTVEREALEAVFIATDAREDDAEFARAWDGFPVPLYRYPSGRGPLNAAAPTPPRLTEGQLAVVDQLVCIRARYFIGTRGSTFTNRVAEARDLAGEDVRTTFNALCPRSPTTTTSEGESNALPAAFDCEPLQRWEPK